MLSFSERLKLLRVEASLTQKKIATAIGITERGYIDLESGKSKPKYDNVVKLAYYFDVSLDYLVGRIDDSASAVFHYQALAVILDERLTVTEKVAYLQLCRVAINGRIKFTSDDVFCDRHSLDRDAFYETMEKLIELGYLSIGTIAEDESPGVVYNLEESAIKLINVE